MMAAAVAAWAAAAACCLEEIMKIISMNTGFRCAHLGENDWQDVTLPHDAMLAEPRNSDSPGGTNTGWFAAKDYEYMTEFAAPNDARYIEFEGVYHRSEVFLDGQKMYSHPNGYFGFKVPVTEGKHTLHIIARNAKQPLVFRCGNYSSCQPCLPSGGPCASGKHLHQNTGRKGSANLRNIQNEPQMHRECRDF